MFGDRAEATRAGKYVVGKHARVKGSDPVSNTDYSPSRPDLALSAHCLIWDGTVRAYNAYVRELSDAEIDTYWREGLIAAPLMGIDTETPISIDGAEPVPFPHTRAAWLTIYEAHIHPRLNLSAAARSIIDSTGSGLFVPWWAHPTVNAGFFCGQRPHRRDHGPAGTSDLRQAPLGSARRSHPGSGPTPSPAPRIAAGARCLRTRTPWRSEVTNYSARPAQSNAAWGS